ncbi:hypothetical protein BH11PSE4_BH11PSE4_14940 [soil metagenome]
MTSVGIRNPFLVMDVPAPDDAEVQAFAASTTLAGDAADVNAGLWSNAVAGGPQNGIEGTWCSRWNGGADPAIPGDAAEKWKQGHAEARAEEDRVYLLFEWDEGARKGLIEARRNGARLVGKYINLSTPAITRPWTGLIVSDERIDGRWPGGRLDFRR